MSYYALGCEWCVSVLGGGKRTNRDGRRVGDAISRDGEHMRLALPLRALLLAAYASGLQFAPRAPAVARSRELVMMGRKFENNKLKMAKTALAYAKKASYIGKKIVIVVKAGGDDPATNLQLAAVMREANALNVPRDVRRTTSAPRTHRTGPEPEP